MKIKSLKFLKKVFTHRRRRRVCVFSIFSILSTFTPGNARRAWSPGRQGGNLAMLLGKPGYAFGETWLCFWGNLAMGGRNINIWLI